MTSNGTRKKTNIRIGYGWEPSPLVRRFADKIAEAAGKKPVLDVACGSGRNALALAQLGCKVICVDWDLTALQSQLVHLRKTAFKKAAAKLSPHQMDLVKERWPFATSSSGGIINVHFLLPTLFPRFEQSLSPGGYLLLETVPGCGGNYLELPQAGELKLAFGKAFEFEFYQERKVGPADCDAVTVRMLARRKLR